MKANIIILKYRHPLIFPILVRLSSQLLSFLCESALLLACRFNASAAVRLDKSRVSFECGPAFMPSEMFG
jgi:hypothetical protein